MKLSIRSKLSLLILGGVVGCTAIIKSANHEKISMQRHTRLPKPWTVFDDESQTLADEDTPILTVSPAGRYAAGTTNRFTAKIWDMHDQDAQPMAIPNKEQYPITALTFSPDDETLAVGFCTLQGKGIVQLFNHQTNYQGSLLTIRCRSIQYIKFSQNGRFLAMKTMRYRAQAALVVDMDNLNILSPFHAPQHSMRNFHSTFDIAFSPDSLYFATATADGKTAVWDTTFQNDPAILDSRSELVTFSPGGNYLAVDPWYEVRVFPTGDLRTPLKTFLDQHLFVDHGDCGSRKNIAFSQDDKFIVIGTEHDIQVHDMEKEAPPKILQEQWSRKNILMPNNRYLISLKQPDVRGTLQIYDTDHLDVPPKVLGHYFHQAHLLPNAKHLLTSSTNGIMVWSLKAILAQMERNRLARFSADEEKA